MSPTPRGGGSAPPARSPANRRLRTTLVGTIAGLLVALAFTAGLGFTRKGKSVPGAPPALAHVARGEWVIRAETPRVSSAGARNVAELIPTQLVARYPELAGRLKVVAGDSKATIKLIVTGFRTRTEAERALARLSLWSVESSFPFRRGVLVEVE